MHRIILTSAGALGALAIGFGAFGAHALRPVFESAADGARLAANWQTASQYHLAHALALALAGLVGERHPGRSARVAAACFALGTVVFSGSLYALCLTRVRALGAVTPVGGALFIAGWLALALTPFAGARARGA